MKGDTERTEVTEVTESTGKSGGTSIGLDAVSATVVDAAIKVHRTPGPGLPEPVDEQCMAHEPASRGSAVHRRKALPVRYGGLVIDAGYRIDLLVEDAVIGEIKPVEALARPHQAQLLTCLKLSGLRLGLPSNVNVPLLEDGIRRLRL